MTNRALTTAVSPAMHRYAAEIYRLQEHHPFVSLADLAEHLDVSAQAVSRMVQRLRDFGLLVHKPYRGVRLTEEGERVSLPAIRRHRLIEVFLVKVMGYDWSEIHDLADVFEQGVDQTIEDRIDQLTGQPTRCPHGDPIPTRDGHMPVLADQSLVELRSGEHGRISRVRTHDPAKLRYLASIGLVPGLSFSLRSCAPFNGPLRLFYEGRDEVLGAELAASIWVEREGAEATQAA
jgi:DtxR family Mn-dependent transcriptional regulator